MSVIWFVIWVICDLVGDRESLSFDPVNLWAATLIAAVALDVNRTQVLSRRRTDA
jgi:hypothetical protein